MSELVHDPLRVRLGKAPAKRDPRTLRLAKYVKALPPPPPAADWTGPVGNRWGMMANDRLGDCTCAAAGHMVQLWTTQAAPPGIVIPDEDVISFYSQVSGYTPIDPSTDRGAIEIEVLNSWRNVGIPGVGHKIAAYVSINPKNPDELKQAINLFGGAYLGIGLPIAAQSQAVWDVTGSTPGDFGTWGGHAVPAFSYYPDGIGVCTWGAIKRMSWAFFSAYCDEAYALISPDWVEADGKSPSGLDLPSLLADLEAVTS